MSEEIQDGEPRADRPPSKNALLIAFFAAFIPTYLFFIHLGKEDLGMNIGVAIGMLMLAVWIHWDLRRQVWLWVTLAVVLPLIMMVRWPAHWAKLMAVVDLLVILGMIEVVENVLDKYFPPKGEPRAEGPDYFPNL